MSYPEKPNDIDKDYLDASDEFESDADVIDNADELDDAADDDIFMAEDEKPKRSGHTKILLAVLVLAVAGGAGAYFYIESGMIPTTPPSVPKPVDTASHGLPTPQAVSDFTTPAPNQPPVVLNQNTANGGSVPALPAAKDDSVAAVSEVGSNDPSGAPHISDKQVPAPAADQAVVPSTPPVPAVNAPAAPVTGPVADTAPNETVPQPVPAQAAVEPDISSLTPIVTTVKSTPAQAAQPKAAESEPVETPKVPASAKAKTKTVADNFYFDAPKGKALTDIPPPSINPMREPGESIIIVQKPGQKVSRHRDEDVVVKKSDESKDIDSRLVNASRASGLGMNDSALGFYNELYNKNSHDPRILMGRAVTLQKLGENQKAIDAYREVLEIEPDNAEAITNLMGLIGKDQPAVALENLLNIHQQYPRNAAVSAQLGIAYAQSDNTEDALKYLNIAAGQDPKNPLHFYNMAVIYDRLGDRLKAIDYYEKSTDVYSIYGSEDKTYSKEQIFDRLSTLRGR